MKTESSQIVYTLSAKCRDCYRCLRVCPVKAIGIKNNQAYVDNERCIACGTCIKECPQGAKVFRNDVENARAVLQESLTTAAILAPSFAAVYSGWKASRLPSALRKLGFSYVLEVSEGAHHVAVESINNANAKPDDGESAKICSACPAVVNFIEKYHPDKVANLIKIVSPMIAQAKITKERYGKDCKVIFIGPCITKKFEAKRPEYKNIVDAVITFDELNKWIKDESIDLSKLEESGFDNSGFKSYARLFPIPGGMLKAGGMENDPTSVKVIHTSGIRNVEELLNTSLENLRAVIIEPLFCDDGCINGPGIGSESSVFEKRANLINYADNFQTDGMVLELKNIDLKTEFSSSSSVSIPKISENEILNVLARTGKTDPSHQLNCGACGYKSCREKAIAVLIGMAQPEMCIPYMRRLAEQRTDKIIETSPNGIVILDKNLQIIGMNPAFKKYFLCSDEIIGRRISYLFDSEGYDKVLAGITDRFESIVSFNGMEFHQLVYSLQPEEQYIGIYVDISKIRMDEIKLGKIRKHTMNQAKELLELQIKMAHDMAKMLGDTTARSEELVWRLMSVYDENE